MPCVGLSLDVSKFTPKINCHVDITDVVFTYYVASSFSALTLLVR